MKTNSFLLVVVVANHHLTSVSTSLQKTARQFFYPAGPISIRRVIHSSLAKYYSEGELLCINSQSVKHADMRVTVTLQIQEHMYIHAKMPSVRVRLVSVYASKANE